MHGFIAKQQYHLTFLLRYYYFFYFNTTACHPVIQNCMIEFLIYHKLFPPSYLAFVIRRMEIFNVLLLLTAMTVAILKDAPLQDVVQGATLLVLSLSTWGYSLSLSIVLKTVKMLVNSTITTRSLVRRLRTSDPSSHSDITTSCSCIK